MNKTLLCIFLILCALLFASCKAENPSGVTTSSTEQKPASPSDSFVLLDECELKVNGVVVESNPSARFYVIGDEHEHVFLPFVSVMRALGAEIYWQNEYVAQIFFKEDEYTLNIQERVLISKEWNDMDFFIPPPGSTRAPIHITAEREILVDNILIRLFLIKEDLSLHIDWTDRKAEISPDE